MDIKTPLYAEFLFGRVLAMSKQVVVIAGPSGSGKNAIINHNCARLVTATTRAMRPGEENGVDYHFFSQERFDEELSKGNIPEHRFVPSLGTFYGIYIPELDKLVSAGKIVFAQVDIEGTRLLKERYNATSIFILPESLEQFKGRLRARNPEWTDKEFEARMKITEHELRVHAPEYDYRIVNADGKLADTVAEVVEILRKEGYSLT
jgi:guanylate kinase